ncbi:hypothetical protein F4805DRAFT_243841 [Annulohypoxylon moriforme]|nr:hypothetical protein F4805DRAFT_243841 [Annulohypoxylon moriforme]
MKSKIFRNFTQKGWRRTGFINVILAFTCGVALLTCLVMSLKRPGSSLNTSTIIYEGPCSNASRLNIALHLLLNLLATGVLASSNFFMQVVASPSREEIDKAHIFLLSLDIGVLSTKNLQHISYFKIVSWLVLVISSLPIHLFLNSSVFETGYQEPNWHLTIAAEEFTQGGDFFPPGASLAPAGSSNPACEYDHRTEDYYTYTDSYGIRHPIIGYGEVVPLESYANKTSPARQNITKTAAVGSSWTKLNAGECRSEYAFCKSRNEYRDVVIVVESGANDPKGWEREEVFNLTHNISLIWDTYVPRSEINSLWYSTQCTTTRSIGAWMSGTCRQSCGGVLGYIDIDSISSYANVAAPPNWTFAFQTDPTKANPVLGDNFGYNDKFSNLTVKYCWAEPNLVDCKVGISNTLLMIVIICIFTKVSQCSVIIWRLPRSSLVTLGDAMESFINKPDSATTGLGTLDISDRPRLEAQPRHYWSPEDDDILSPMIQPRQWLPKNRRLLSTIPRIVWAHTYGLLLVSLTILTIFLVSSYKSNNFSFQGSFGRSDDILISQLGDTGYLSELLITNVPQILLSLCYFSYNGFFTRLLVEQEWNSYSQRFQPLRVSYPIGRQISTYRLQLPYKYSIPLLSISVLCHWLLSNAFFLFVMEGGMLYSHRSRREWT